MTIPAANPLDQALRLLNARMVYHQMDPIHLVVCGGFALIEKGLLSRVTADVDVLGRWSGTPKRILQTDGFDPGLTALVAEVGKEFRLRADWLNLAAAAIWRMGLPPGSHRRLKRRKYGLCISLSFLGRQNLIALKIFAAMDPQDGERHLADLLDMDPSRREVAASRRWLRTRKTSASFRRKLNEVLERIGHADS